MDEMVRKQNILDAIEKCHKRCCRTDSNGDEWIHYETTLNEVENLPPVQPKNGTLVIPLNESDFKSVKRIMLDNKPWCRTFYEEGGEAIPMDWIKEKQNKLVSDYKYIIDWLILEWKREQGEINNGNQ